MRRFIFLTSVLFSVFGFQSISSAFVVDRFSRPKEVTVQRGKKVRVLGQMDVDPRGCQILSTPELKLENGGRLGVFTSMTDKIDVNENASVLGRQQCKLSNVPRLQVFYEAKESGTEDVSILINMRGWYERYSFRLTVK